MTNPQHWNNGSIRDRHSSHRFEFWVSPTRGKRNHFVDINPKRNAMNSTTFFRLTLVCLLAGMFGGLRVSAQDEPASAGTAPAETLVAEASPAPVIPVADPKMPDIVGTWTGAEGGAFPKLTIWPVENRDGWFFVEAAEGNGLLERKAASNFQGCFTFNLLGDRTVQASLMIGPKERPRLIITPFEDQ